MACKEITFTIAVVMFVRSEAPKSAEWQRHLSFSATKSAGG
jgi:hypothetical protein